MRRPRGVVAVAALLLLELPLAFRDLAGEARRAPPARRAAAFTASERERIANAFARTPTGWRPELRELERAVAAAEAALPEDGTLTAVSPDEIAVGLLADRMAGLLYPRAVRLLAWPLGRPLPQVEARPDLWILRLGEPHDPSADPAAAVLATGERFTLWHYPGAPR